MIGGIVLSIFFAHKTWPQLEEYIKNDALILMPIGTIEEHGRHLPVETDARIIEDVAVRVAEDIKNDIPVLVMPTIWSGYSPKQMNKWPGTIRLRTRVFTDMVYDICASIIEMGFQKIIMLDGHGQHAPMLNMVTKEIADEYGVYIAVTSPLVFSLEEFNKVRKSEKGGVLHACEWETSLMLLFTNRVNIEEMTDVDIMRYHSNFVAGDSASGGQKVVWSTWGLQDSKTGVYGDPTVASKETGQAILNGILENYREFIVEYYNFNKDGQ